jgi:hypothetical protein
MTNLAVDFNIVLPALRFSPRGLNPKGFSSELSTQNKRHPHGCPLYLYGGEPWRYVATIKKKNLYAP